MRVLIKYGMLKKWRSQQQDLNSPSSLIAQHRLLHDHASSHRFAVIHHHPRREGARDRGHRCVNKIKEQF